MIPRRVIVAVTGTALAAMCCSASAQAERPSLNALQSQVGSVFIRWGNATAPEGTTLIYSGFGFGGYFTSSAPYVPTVIQTGDPGAGAPSSSGMLYPLVTALVAGGNPLNAPGIAAMRYVRAAVCYAPGPTTVIWGTHTAPAGWRVLYCGYALGPYLSHSNPTGPICVDTDAFDNSQDATSSWTSSALLYPVQIAVAPPGYTAGAYLKCAVIMKD